MHLIVGLGNPGKKYEKARHNVGFLVLDEFAKEHNFPEFSLSKKHSSLISEDVLNRVKAVLVKPQTFMNNSGKAVKSLMRTKPKLIVVHDDIDIKLGNVKIAEARGTAGHKGVESIVQALGTKDFIRIRVGIQPEKGKPGNVEDFVLQLFKKSELPLLQSAIQEAGVSLSSLIG